jgi:hydrogenase/urease accessory protein HupE
MKLALILISLVGATCFGLAHAHYAGHVAADLLLGATWPPTGPDDGWPDPDDGWPS